MQKNTQEKIEKLGKLFDKIASLQEQYDALKAEIIEEMESEDLKKQESKNYKVTIKYSIYTSYSDDILTVLHKKAPVAIKEVCDNKVIKELLSTGALKMKDIKKYISTSERKSFTLSEK